MTAPTTAASVAALVSIALAMVLAVLGDPVLQNSSDRPTLHAVAYKAQDGDAEDEEDNRSVDVADVSESVVKVDKSKHKVPKFTAALSSSSAKSSSSKDVDDEKEVDEEETVTTGTGYYFDNSSLTDLPPPGSYVPSNCSACRDRAEFKEISLQIIKDDILSKIGLSMPPNITGKSLPTIPPLHHLVERYGMQSDSPGHFMPGPVISDDDDDFHSKTQKVIAFAQPVKLRHTLNRKDVLHFNFSEKITRNRVMKAIMWIYIKPISLTEADKIVASGPHLEHTITIEILPVLRSNVGDSVTLMKTRPYKENAQEGWIKIPATKLLQSWFTQPSTNLGIVINATDSRGKYFPIVDGTNEKDKERMPFVEVQVEDSRKHRIKRTIGLVCEEKTQETRCCRYPLTVDFEEFGWDWIIAPKKYEANYCSGECPYVFLQKYPHTHIVQQANPTGTAGPCCAPRKMSPISMLYFDNEHNIVYGLLPGMVVDRCGCS